MIINSSNINELRNQVQKIKKENPREKIIVRARDFDFNRKILETKGVDVLLGPEITSKKENLKQVDSGLNEVLCTIAKKNNISIGIDLEKILGMNKLEKSKTLAKVMQNLRLCKKAKIDIFPYSREKYEKQDTIAFLLTFR